MTNSRRSTKDQPENVNPETQCIYREMVGSLLYISSWTRHDIAYAVPELSRFVSNPGFGPFDCCETGLSLSQDNIWGWDCLSNALGYAG